VTGANLYDIVSFAHPFAFLVEHDSVLVKYTGLPIDDGARLSQFLGSRPRALNLLFSTSRVALVVMGQGPETPFLRP